MDCIDLLVGLTPHASWLFFPSCQDEINVLLKLESLMEIVHKALSFVSNSR